MKKKVTVYTNKSRSLWQSIAETFEYRDLISLFAKRNVTVKYKQTILGPLWLILLPIIETLISAFVFGDILGVKGGVVPYFLFYSVGSTVWYLFSSCAKGTGNVFTANARIFQKVYYPRLVMPLSDIITVYFAFLIRLGLMLVIILAFVIYGVNVAPVWGMFWLIPLLLLQTSFFALGVGLTFSALTAKYRDLSNLLSVFIDLFKYLSPVIYTVLSVEGGLKTFCLLNPVTPVIEAFRYIVLGAGNGEFSPVFLIYSFVAGLFALFVGLFLFNHAERNSVDVL